MAHPEATPAPDASEEERNGWWSETLLQSTQRLEELGLVAVRTNFQDEARGKRSLRLDLSDVMEVRNSGRAIFNRWIDALKGANWSPPAKASLDENNHGMAELMDAAEFVVTHRLNVLNDDTELDVFEVYCLLAFANRISREIYGKGIPSLINGFHRERR